LNDFKESFSPKKKTGADDSQVSGEELKQELSFLRKRVPGQKTAVRGHSLIEGRKGERSWKGIYTDDEPKRWNGTRGEKNKKWEDMLDAYEPDSDTTT